MKINKELSIGIKENPKVQEYCDGIKNMVKRYPMYFDFMEKMGILLYREIMITVANEGAGSERGDSVKQIYDYMKFCINNKNTNIHQSAPLGIQNEIRCLIAGG